MSALRDWARLDARWYEDPVLRACAKEAPAAFAMWPVLVAMAKAQSHVDDNPEGRVRVSMDDLARACCVTNRRAIAALESLADAEFVTVDAHRVGVLCIRLSSFAKWQTPRKSKAEQAANRRTLTSRAFSSLGSHHVAIELPSSRDGVGIVLPQTETLTETLTETEEPLSSSAKPKRDFSGEAREVFEHWVKVWNKRANTVFSTERKTATVARLKSGYTVAQLKEAVEGYRHSKHHRGENASGKPFDDLELFMRSAAKVDAGMAYATAAASGTSVTNSAAARHNVGEEYDDGIQWHDNQNPAA